MDARWQELLPQLVLAYMRWREAQTSALPTADLDANTDAEGDVNMSEFDFEIDCIDLFSLCSSVTIRRSPQDSPAVGLIKNGFLAATPVSPTIVVSLKTLELFYDIRRFKASLSVEAFTKLICFRYFVSLIISPRLLLTLTLVQVPYRRRFRKAISNTFDVYMTLMDQVHTNVQQALGRDAPNWRVLHACPACSYKLDGETPAMYERMVVMDGNNSLKRVATGTRKVGDTCKFNSEYYLPPDVVERFAGEVKQRQAQPHVEVPPDGNQDDASGDPTDGAPDSSCTSNWKAAAADDKKRMWAIFEETGVFAAACRHGFVLWLIDMVRSSELAKFPLAITSQLIEVIQTSIMLGFDIGCTFKITLKNSSLGTAFEALGGRVCVNAFHGYSHSYPCQLHNHPNVIPGMGLEDLETLERVFSASNQLASVTRYASAYRRSLLIHTYFRQWDEDKYTNQGLFLYNNCAQALDIIKTKRPVLEESLALWTPWDLHAVAYVEALQELRAASEELGKTSQRFLNAAPKEYTWRAPNAGPTNYYNDAGATARVEARRRELSERVLRLTSEVIALELQLNIASRWQPGDKEYEETIKYINHRKYQQALGRLQRLVIQRLFELHRLNVAQTAYRMRTQIAKSLQKRSKAIRKAVSQLNQARAAIGRLAVDFLEEFHLLQDTRNDIRNRPWAQPLIRETMRTARRLERAEEEIVNVNREARRVHTSIHDEDLLFTEVLDDLRRQGDPRLGVVCEYIRRRRATNAYILAHLRRLYALDGFTGDSTPGTYAGRPRECRTSATSDAPSTHADSPTSGSAPPTPIQATSLPLPLPNLEPAMDTLEQLTGIESATFADDVEDGEILADEDEDGAVTDLVEHISNIAAVMNSIIYICNMASESQAAAMCETKDIRLRRLLQAATHYLYKVWGGTVEWTDRSLEPNSWGHQSYPMTNTNQQGPFWVVLGGPEAKTGIWLNQRPPATALGRFQPLVPIVIVVKSYDDAALVNSLNKEIFQHVATNDYAGLKAAIKGFPTGNCMPSAGLRRPGYGSPSHDEVEHLKMSPGAKYQGFDRFLNALLFMIEKEPYRRAAQVASGPSQRIEPGIEPAAPPAAATVPFPTYGSGSAGPMASGAAARAPGLTFPPIPSLRRASIYGTPPCMIPNHGGPTAATQMHPGGSISAANSPLKFTGGSGSYGNAATAGRPTVKTEPIDDIDQISHFMRMMFDTLPVETRALRSLVGPLGWHDPRAVGQAPLTFGQQANEFLRARDLPHNMYITVLQARLYSVHGKAFGYALHRELGWPVEDGEELWGYLELPVL
ncbi:hypothetical protein C8Q80DRAFT_1342386 [Daedaleopsis nitida]|nr:hypothetical protein C8Q80DRAFT_1342386 [Daedaleopsis nitida]